MKSEFKHRFTAGVLKIFAFPLLIESDNEKTIILDKTEEEEKNLSRSVQNIMRKCSPIINDDDEENETSMVTNKIVTDNVIDEMSICLPKIGKNIVKLHTNSELQFFLPPFL